MIRLPNITTDEYTALLVILTSPYSVVDSIYPDDEESEKRKERLAQNLISLRNRLTETKTNEGL